MVVYVTSTNDGWVDEAPSHMSTWTVRKVVPQVYGEGYGEEWAEDTVSAGYGKENSEG